MSIPTRLEKTVTSVILFFGVLLPLVQFLFNRSLCGDEVWLALNIVERDLSGLLKPLDYVQSAPILFLQIEKLLSGITPYSEFGLKIFPLISYWLSLVYFYKILKIVHKNHYSIIFSLSLFVFNIFFIRYSNEVKQYMTDAFVLLFIYYLTLKAYKKPQPKYAYLAIVGAIAIYLSNASIVILFTVGLFLLYDFYRYKKKQYLLLAGVYSSWILAFGIYYLLFIRDNPVKDQMMGMWNEAFMPVNPFTYQFYAFIIEKGSMLLLQFFQYGNLGEILIVFIILGIISMIKERRVDLLILILSPVVLLFIMSGLKLYPVLSRTWLFVSPPLIILCSYGFSFAATPIFSRIKIIKFNLVSIGIPLLMICYFCFLIRVDSYPIRRSEIRDSIKYLNENVQKDDKVYVTYFAGWAYQYYKKISFAKLDNEIQIGTNTYKKSATDYYLELDSLKGRTWFLFTYFGDENNDNREIVLNYLSSKNQLPVTAYHAVGSDVYLYELNK